VIARTELREATRTDHDRVDAIFSRFDLTNLGAYGAFLSAQAAAFLPVEAALDAAGAIRLVADWPERRRGHLLEADLRALGRPVPERGHTECRLDGSADLLGALYVLEGSRLGGSLLKRQVPPAWPRRFLDAPQAAGAWRSLLILLDKWLDGPEERRAAAAAARGVFGLFEAAALAQLRTEP
jgi:heme oxygenase (biliverdin-IX-beta and delta-forming)